MDNLLEILIPLLFFAIYFVSNFLGKKSEDKQEQPEENGGDDFRKIREELRRKIQERRGNQGQEQAREATAQEEATANRGGGAVLRESHPRRGMSERRTAPPEFVEEVPVFKNESNFERDLEVQMEEVRRSKEKADAARQQANDRVAAISRIEGSRSTTPRSSASYRQFLREALGDPENLQRSFILHEVFGTPVGMRRDGQMRPTHEL